MADAGDLLFLVSQAASTTESLVRELSDVNTAWCKRYMHALRQVLCLRKPICVLCARRCARALLLAP